MDNTKFLNETTEGRDKAKSPFTTITTSSLKRVLSLTIAFLHAKKMICSRMLNSIAFAVLLLPRLLIGAVYDIEDIIRGVLQVCDNEVGCIQKITRMNGCPLCNIAFKERFLHQIWTAEPHVTYCVGTVQSV
jgi:hypothetical protein